MAEKNFDGTFDHELLESVFRTSKKVIQEYVREIDRTNRYRSVRSSVVRGTVLDDRGPLIDLYEACLQQDAHIRAVLETLVSQILGDRYMLARQNEKGKYINVDRKRLANEIVNAAQNKVIVTGLDDEIDIKTFTMSNSEKIYTGLIDFVNKEVSNMILGSESMAGATQSYVGSTKAHQDIFRERIEVYRRFIENVMNEQVLPSLVDMGYLPGGLEFKYSTMRIASSFTAC